MQRPFMISLTFSKPVEYEFNSENNATQILTLPMLQGYFYPKHNEANILKTI